MLQTQTTERPSTPSMATVSQGTAAAWDAMLEHYRRTAAGVLDTHVKHGASCSACGQSWPCSPAMAAAFALEL
jgi:hypothetical protein